MNKDQLKISFRSYILDYIQSIFDKENISFALIDIFGFCFCLFPILFLQSPTYTQSACETVEEGIRSILKEIKRPLIRRAI